MGPEYKGMLRDLSKATRRKMPTCTRRVLTSAIVGVVSVMATCIYSTFRIHSSEESFQVLQQTQLKAIGHQVMLGIKRQLQTSVASTKALSALINFDDGENLLAAIGPAVDELGVKSQELAMQPERLPEGETTEVPDEEDAENMAPNYKVDVEELTRAQNVAINNIILNSSHLKLNAVADALISTYQGISYLELAPGGVTSAIYPLEGHEDNLGTHLLFEPSLVAAAAASINSRSVLFSGPVTLSSGKRGIIAYNPTFVDTPDFVGHFAGDPSWWGFTGMVCSLDELFLVTPLAGEEIVNMSYVLYSKTSEGIKLLAASDDIPGEETEEGAAATWYAYAIDQSPVTTSFEMEDLGVEWEMLVWPKGGWQAHGDTFAMQIVLCIFFTICSAVGMYSMLVRESVLQQVAGVIDRYSMPSPKEVWSAKVDIEPDSEPSPPSQSSEPAFLR